jgi:hypothetical protein
MGSLPSKPGRCTGPGADHPARCASPYLGWPRPGSREENRALQRPGPHRTVELAGQQRDFRRGSEHERRIASRHLHAWLQPMPPEEIGSALAAVRGWARMSGEAERRSSSVIDGSTSLERCAGVRARPTRSAHLREAFELVPPEALTFGYGPVVTNSVAGTPASASARARARRSARDGPRSPAAGAGRPVAARRGPRPARRPPPGRYAARQPARGKLALGLVLLAEPVAPVAVSASRPEAANGPEQRSCGTRRSRRGTSGRGRRRPQARALGLAWRTRRGDRPRASLDGLLGRRPATARRRRRARRRPPPRPRPVPRPARSHRHVAFDEGEHLRAAGGRRPVPRQGWPVRTDPLNCRGLCARYGERLIRTCLPVPSRGDDCLLNGVIGTHARCFRAR